MLWESELIMCVSYLFFDICVSLLFSNSYLIWLDLLKFEICKDTKTVFLNKSSFFLFTAFFNVFLCLVWILKNIL